MSIKNISGRMKVAKVTAQQLKFLSTKNKKLRSKAKKDLIEVAKKNFLLSSLASENESDPIAASLEQEDAKIDSGYTKEIVIERIRNIFSNALESAAEQFGLDLSSSTDRTILLLALSLVHASKGKVGRPRYWTEDKVARLREEVEARRCVSVDSDPGMPKKSENQIFDAIARRKIFPGQNTASLRRAYQVHINTVAEVFE